MPNTIMPPGLSVRAIGTEAAVYFYSQRKGRDERIGYVYKVPNSKAVPRWFAAIEGCQNSFDTGRHTANDAAVVLYEAWKNTPIQPWRAN